MGKRWVKTSIDIYNNIDTKKVIKWIGAGDTDFSQISMSCMSCNIST